MQTIKSIGWVVGLSVVAGGLFAAPTRAESSFSDITGTNIWNNTAPVFETEGRIDPDLLSNITRVNQESETAFRACEAAIAQIEQTAPTGGRRFARRPSDQTAAVPAACRQLEALRAEADNLRRSVEDIGRARSGSAFAAW